MKNWLKNLKSMIRRQLRLLTRDLFILKQEAKQWQYRKEALDVLLTILQKNPRLQDSDYLELIGNLNRVCPILLKKNV